MMAISEILNKVLFGVSIGKIGLFFIIILFTFIIKSIFVYFLDKKLTVLVNKTKSELDDLLLKAIKSPLCYLLLTIREEFNLKIMQLMEKLGVEVAFTSQTIYLNEKMGVMK